ncbi:hypothetical protein [Sphingomonas daechungensis]|uniref:hypothetical protein n=1 Tax=Sphingomonas daechungensis TaxID=1176646 RepID=UPI0037849BBE
MNVVELKVRLDRILAEEEGEGAVDWEIVEDQSNKLLGELPAPIPLVVEAYLLGSSRRREDGVFAHAQRSQLLSFLRDTPS